MSNVVTLNTSLDYVLANTPETPFIISDAPTPDGYIRLGYICISKVILQMDSRMMYVTKFIVDNVIDNQFIPGLDRSSIFCITGFNDINKFRIESMNEDETLHSLIVYDNGKLTVAVV